jgi:hypothetical protein
MLCRSEVQEVVPCLINCGPMCIQVCWNKLNCLQIVSKISEKILPNTAIFFLNSEICIFWEDIYWKNSPLYNWNVVTCIHLLLCLQNQNITFPIHQSEKTPQGMSTLSCTCYLDYRWSTMPMLCSLPPMPCLHTSTTTEQPPILTVPAD